MQLFAFVGVLLTRAFALASDLVAGVGCGSASRVWPPRCRLIPGLGQAHAGRWAEAGSALLVNGVFVATAVELGRRRARAGLAAVMVFETGFYAGNILGAGAGAARTTRARWEARIAELNSRRPLVEVASGSLVVHTSGEVEARLRFGCLGLLVGLAACAPPDAPTRPASVRILHPVAAEDAVVPLSAAGMLELLVVVDIDGVELVDPAGGLDNAEGQGHWHLYLNNEYFVPRGYDYELSTDAFEVGESIDMVAALQHNDHSDMVPPECDPCENRMEFTVGEAEAD